MCINIAARRLLRYAERAIVNAKRAERHRLPNLAISGNQKLASVCEAHARRPSPELKD